MLRAQQLLLMAQSPQKQIVDLHGFSVEIKSTYTVLHFPPTSTVKQTHPSAHRIHLSTSGLQTGSHQTDAGQSRNLRWASPMIISLLRT